MTPHSKHKNFYHTLLSVSSLALTQRTLTQTSIPMVLLATLPSVTLMHSNSGDVALI